VDAVDGVDFRSGKIGYDIDAVKQVACKFLEILHLADFVHFINNSIQNGLDLLVRLFLKKRTLALQPGLVPEKLFLIKGGDVPFSALSYCHEGTEYNSPMFSLQASF
jgi:hypothetical protein